MNKPFIPLKLLLNNVESEEALDKYFLQSIHTVKEMGEEIDNIVDDIDIVTCKKGKKTINLYNVACAFDIETTSFYKEEGKKSALMYVWQFMINGYIVMGRTWDDLQNLIKMLTEKLELSESMRLPVYVHNLGYEFQFMRKYFIISDFFATDKRTPARFCIGGVEFRDSLILSGYALRNLNKAMVTKVYKKEGDLDYSLMRHSKTPLTDTEKLYCIYDVYVVSVFIYEKLINGETVTTIPYTKTGYVRKYVKKHTIEGKGNDAVAYRKLIKKLTITPHEYERLRLTYQGGFTHANPLYVDDVIENVRSKDFTSSYPTVLIAEKYPMSKGRRVKLKDTQRKDDGAVKLFESLRKYDYCFLCQIYFKGLKSKIEQDCYISKSKCEFIEGCKISNGRVYEADELITNITDVDFDIIKEVYTWESMEIAELYIYKLKYLPKALVMCIIDFYFGKTTLKDVKGKELEYQKAKELLNAIYGMMCQNPLQDINEYDGEWSFEKVDIEDGIEKYNTSKSRTTFYPWGVWCCAYARRNLWLDGILKLGNDYIYSDTDSCKYMNPDEHEYHFAEYNKNIIKKLEAAMVYHGLDKSMIKPKTQDGEEKPLGVWDPDGDYLRFKTLGAKRYLVETKTNEIKATIAGLPKSAGKEFFKKQKDPFEVFAAGDKKHPLKISAEESNKNVLTYIDDDTSGVLTDYLGQSEKYTSLSCIHMEKTAFSLSLSDEFLDFIHGAKDVFI